MRCLIFSSIDATFGESIHHPIDEVASQNAIGSYGHGTWVVEQRLQDLCYEIYDVAHDLTAICLRCFNAAGADHTDRCELVV